MYNKMSKNQHHDYIQFLTFKEYPFRRISLIYVNKQYVNT